MSTHVSDFTRSDEQVLLDLINFDNESNLSIGQVTFGIPQGEEDNTPTVIDVTAVAGGGYTGSEMVAYNRIAISEMVGVVTPGGLVLQQGDAEDIHDLVPEINAALGINLGLDEVVNSPLPAAIGTPNEVLSTWLVIDQSVSLVWASRVQIQVEVEDIALSSVITETVLGGLNLPVVNVTPQPTNDSVVIPRSAFRLVPPPSEEASEMLYLDVTHGSHTAAPFMTVDRNQTYFMPSTNAHSSMVTFVVPATHPLLTSPSDTEGVLTFYTGSSEATFVFDYMMEGPANGLGYSTDYRGIIFSQSEGTPLFGTTFDFVRLSFRAKTAP